MQSLMHLQYSQNPSLYFYCIDNERPFVTLRYAFVTLQCRFPMLENCFLLLQYCIADKEHSISH